MRLIGDVLASGAWGLSVASLLLKWDVQGFSTIVQLLIALAGLFYLIFVKIPHEIKMNKETRANKSLQNEVLKNEIEEYEEGLKEVNRDD